MTKILCIKMQCIVWKVGFDFLNEIRATPFNIRRDLMSTT